MEPLSVNIQTVLLKPFPGKRAHVFCVQSCSSYFSMCSLISIISCMPCSICRRQRQSLKFGCIKYNLVRDLFGHFFPPPCFIFTDTHTHRNGVLLVGSCIGNVLCHLGPLQTPDVNNYCSYIIYTFANQCFATVLSSNGAAACVC